jgi:hypothetical protein
LTLPAADLISERATREWDAWTKRIAAEASHTLPPPSLDTVGALALGADGALAAGVSRCAIQPYERETLLNLFFCKWWAAPEAARQSGPGPFCLRPPCEFSNPSLELGRHIWGRMLGVISGTPSYGCGVQRIRYAIDTVTTKY